MSEQSSHLVERYCDVAVVGGSAAGLAAALQLGRQRRSVIVVDAGEPRNAPAASMHSYLGHDGLAPAALIATGREEVRSYGGEILLARATAVTHADDARFGFRVELSGGHAIRARRVLAATGLVDQLPDVPGLAERWGHEVIHCPFCHGYEFRDQRIVQLVTHPSDVRKAGLFRQLTARLTVVLHEVIGADIGQLEALESAGVRIVPGPAARVRRSHEGRVAAVELAGGQRIEADAVAVSPGFRARAEAFRPLGLQLAAHPSGMGDVVEVDATGETAVPGLYAAGNVTDPTQQVAQAAAAGSWVGGLISFVLADEDRRSPARVSANQDDWDHRYGGERMWSGNPNGTLVDVVSALAPARALDVGAGEGGDAVWLAERGWRVTATDISRPALARVAAEARRRELAVDCRLADANALTPFESAAFDLVSAQYASIPRTPDNRAERNLMDAVAPGGHLLVVSHDLEPMRARVDGSSHGQVFDPDSYVRVEDFAAALARAPEWQVEVHEKRPRPAGAASASHHVDDVVLLARRAPG